MNQYTQVGVATLTHDINGEPRRLSRYVGMVDARQVVAGLVADRHAGGIEIGPRLESAQLIVEVRRQHRGAVFSLSTDARRPRTRS